MSDTKLHPYLEALSARVLIYDGAMGTNIQLHHPTPEDFGGKSLEGCNDHLVLTRPDIIQSIHESFLAVGCDVVETCTFQSTPHRLREWGIEEKTRALNVAAARLARAACEKFATPDRPRFVAGSIGPTGMLPSSSDPVLSNTTFSALAENYYEQAKYLVEGGVDVLLVETAQDILEVKAALAGFERLFSELGRRVPVQTQVTLDTSGRMLLGTDIASALTTLEALPIDVIGLNCSTGPEHMREPIRYLTSNALRPISCIPNAGLPLNTGTGDAVYPLEPAPMAEMLGEFVEKFGVRIVGGCCGTRPEHLKAIVERVRSAPSAVRSAPSIEQEVAPRSTLRALRHSARVSSAMRATDLKQDPPPLLIGERVNSQGSRKVKRLLLADDYEGIVDVAREQVDSGAHVLDVCVALTERADEGEQMAKVVKLLSMSVETPIMVDSTEANVIEAALEHIPGRAVINSINMENGRQRIDAVVPLAKKHGAALVALTIDEIGMAKTRERKLDVARAIYEIVVNEYGMQPEDLIYDDLTFTLATGDPEMAASAIETIEGIRLIKRELPGVFTSLGVSNVSFGLAPEARAVVNSVFLHHCVEAGLDMAIVNPAHVKPYAEIDASDRALADDLIFNKRPDALQRLIEGLGPRGSVLGKAAAVEDPTEDMAPEQRVHYMVVHRKKDGIEEALDAAGVRATPVRVLNEVLLPAMKEVGDKFGAGELILPFVLQSAEVMKRAVRHLEQFLEKAEGYTKGKVVLATVYGDVHDIGKSLVNTILSNNGYTVYDLGKQVPVNTIIEKALEVDADAIGLSALLVSTSKQMPLCVQELDKRGLDIPVLIGGAAINRRFGRRALFVEGERAYEPGVFYCKDAFEGLETMDVLQNDDASRREAFVAKLLDDARRDVFLRTAVGKDIAVGDQGGERSNIAQDHPVPKPAFVGSRVLRDNDIPLDEVFALLDLDELYRLQWGARGSGPQYEATVKNEFEPVLARLTREAKRDGWLEPKAVYGFFPTQSRGNDLLIYDPLAYSRDGTTHEIARFHFPRQEGRERLCIADYFRSVESSDVDVVGLQVVTVGDRAAQKFQELQSAGEYTEAFYVHGLAVETAEALAEWLHRRLRRELGVPGGRGKRYSWGYGACPELEDHATVFKLLPVERELGMELTSAFQLVPEQSTAAIIVHHPDAKYYAVRGSTADTTARGELTVASSR